MSLTQKIELKKEQRESLYPAIMKLVENQQPQQSDQELAWAALAPFFRINTDLEGLAREILEKTYDTSDLSVSEQYQFHKVILEWLLKMYSFYIDSRGF